MQAGVARREEDGLRRREQGPGCGPGAQAGVVGLILAHVYHGF